MRGRRRKYRVGAKTVNFTSAGLVASAIVVVMAVTAPSGVAPSLFASPSHVRGPSLPALPFQSLAPAAAREPVSQLGLSTTTASGSGSGVPRGGTTTVTSHTVSSAITAVPTVTLPPAQHSSAIAAPAGPGETGAGHGLGTTPDSGSAGAAASDARSYASGNVPNRPGGNGNGGNGNGGNGNGDHGAGGEGHGDGQSFTSAGSPAVQGTFGPSVPLGAVGSPERGPAPDAGTGDPSNSGSQEGPPSAPGHSWGDGQDGHPGGPPGHPSHSRG